MIYEIAYGSAEDSSTILLEHHKEYSFDEFNKIVINAIINMLKEWKKGGRGLNKKKAEDVKWLFESPEIMIRFLRCRRKWPAIGSTAELFPYIGTWMEKYGFKVIRPARAISFFGWADPFNVGDWDGHTDAIDMVLMKALKKAGFAFKDSTQANREKRMRKFIKQDVLKR